MKRKLKPQKQKKSYIIAIGLVIILVSIFLWQGGYIFRGPESRPQVFIIEKGEGVKEISSRLKGAGLLKSRTLFVFLAFLEGKYNNLMAGAYELSGTMTVSEVLNKISSGDVLKEEVTVIEGWTLKDIASLLESRQVAGAEKFLEVVSAPVNSKFAHNFVFLKEKPKDAGLEGYLFPDTYYIGRAEPIENIIEMMLANLEQKLTTQLKQAITEQGKTLFEVLIMASLLEKEVKIYEDKQLAAGLLWKRLKAGWPLQVDATLTYLTGKVSSQLTQDDLFFDSLYNTYKYKGLPIGPICNPGLESIKAAVYYKDSPNWFYLTTLEGETVFSETLEKHALNKQKHLK